MSVALAAAALAATLAACSGERGGSTSDDLRIEDAPATMATDSARASFVVRRAAGSGADTASGVAEPPRATLDARTAATPSHGRRVRVRTGAALDRALREARPGDEILLAPGTTYTGNFRLPRIAGSGDAAWVTIRTEGSALPAEGTRVTPAAGRGLARLVTRNAKPALATEPGAHHFRIAGLEIGAAPEVKRVNTLVALGDGGPDQRSLASVPHHLVLDRVYVHGHPALEVRRCVALNSASTAIVDSYLAECHSNDGDSQAIWGSNGPGPYRIAGNYLEGAGENLMFGGSDPPIRGLVPADIEILRNHFFKPLSWQGKWASKNLLELKTGQRVLIEGNVFENSWVSGQIGFAIVLWSVNQDGGAPWTTTRDITFRYNRIDNVNHGFQLNDREEKPSVPMTRVAISHNLVRGVGTPAMGGGGGRVFQVNGNVADLAITHNTSGSRGPWLLFVSQPPVLVSGLVVRDNVAFESSPAVRSDYGVGAAALALYLGPRSVFSNNVLAGWQGAERAGNYFPGSAEAIGFADARGGDYALSRSSRYRGLASDRGDPGADLLALDSATAGVAPRR